MQEGQMVTVMGNTHNCSANMVINQETRNKVVRVLDRLKREIANQLSIVRANRLELRDDYPWCYDESIDMRSRYGTSARNAMQTQIDVVFFVTAWPARGAAAWCGYCRTDQYGRPIGGHMNFSPSHVATSSELELYATAMHELYHGLGFEQNRVQKQIRNGRVVSGVETITIGSQAEGTKEVDIVTSPRVVAEARKHFNCPTLRGVELEDYAKQGRYGSHWEKRVMGTDVITPTLHQDDQYFGPRVSRITLAYFEDLGYYYPNYTSATNFGYGLGAGCDFLLRPARFRPVYACQGNSHANRCSPERDGIGWCAGIQLADVPDALSAARRGQLPQGGRHLRRQCRRGVLLDVVHRPGHAWRALERPGRRSHVKVLRVQDGAAQLPRRFLLGHVPADAVPRRSQR
jgi:hypothetical protein